MQILSKLESRLGLTRGDVTVALFLSFAAFAGFVYTTFFANPATARQQRELYELIARHDSILSHQHNSRLAELETSLAAADSGTDDDTASVPEWQPLTDSDADRDKIEQKARGGSDSAPKRKLTAPIDINTASKSDLELLPGVGGKTAERIIEYRASKRFSKIEDIMNVKGIGPKKFEKMRKWLKVE